MCELEFVCFTEDSLGRAMETKRGREEEEWEMKVGEGGILTCPFSTPVI